jgi:probable phosphomutase (TIGR03848 family)
MTLLFLVRHAVTDVTGKRLSGSIPGIHLSAQGRDQAEKLVERLAPLRLTEIYASPLERCVETAEPIAAARRMEVKVLHDLEEIGYGRCAGRSIAQLMKSKLWRRIQLLPSSVEFPGGETLIGAQRRAVAALNAMAARAPRGAVLVVSHADVIRLALAHYAGAHIDLFQRFTVSPASVSAIALGDRIPRILRINDTGSLGDLVGRERPLGPGQAKRRQRGDPHGPRNGRNGRGS